MRKRDCLYLHALCVLLRDEIADRREFDADAFESYERLDIGPTEIHRPKTDHREALTELLTALSGRVEGPAASTDRTRFEVDDTVDGERP